MVTFELTLIQVSFFFIFIFIGTFVVTIYHKSWFKQVNGKKNNQQLWLPRISYLSGIHLSFLSISTHNSFLHNFYGYLNLFIYLLTYLHEGQNLFCFSICVSHIAKHLAYRNFLFCFCFFIGVLLIYMLCLFIL